MRLLITTDTVGGVWTFTRELSAGLLDRGCHVRLVSFGRMPSDSQRADCAALAQRFPLQFAYVASDIALEWMDENGRVMEAGSRLLRREAALFGPDLIHCNQFCFGALETAVPRLITAHSDVLSWASACRDVPLEQSSWLDRYVAMVQAGLLASSAVAAPTRWMMLALAENFTLPEISVIIPNGRSLATDPLTRDDRTAPLQAVTAGRLWDEAKGIDLLAEFESPIPIAIAGEMREASRADWSGVRWTGQLAEGQMIKLLRSSSIYLCLSKYEPFGLAALEAALCGCAVVSRDIAPLREVWAESAFYFRDARELRSILHMLKEDATVLLRARTGAQRRAQLFSRDRMVEGYLGLFEQTLRGALRAEHVA